MTMSTHSTNNLAFMRNIELFRLICIIVSLLLADFIPTIWKNYHKGKLVVMILLVALVIIFNRWCKYILIKSGKDKSLVNALTRSELYPYILFGGLYTMVYLAFDLGGILM